VKDYKAAFKHFGRPVGTAELARYLDLDPSGLAARLKNKPQVVRVGLRPTVTGRAEYLWSWHEDVDTENLSEPALPDVRGMVRQLLPATVPQLTKQTGKSRTAILWHLSKLNARADDRHYPPIWRLK
jgi:hypothetical protein